jgi:hypothetical protein
MIVSKRALEDAVIKLIRHVSSVDLFRVDGDAVYLESGTVQ